MSKLQKVTLLSVFIVLLALFGGLAATAPTPVQYGTSMVLLIATLLAMIGVFLRLPSLASMERCDCQTGGPCRWSRGELPSNQYCPEVAGRVLHP